MEREPDTSRPATPDHGAHLIDLIINQDDAAQSWLRFFFTIESALAAAFLLLMNSGEHVARAPRWFMPAVSLLIPLLGIVFTRALMRIVLRQNQWQIWFIRRYNALPGADKVFPSDIGREGAVELQPDGYVSRIVRHIGAWITLAWVIIALLVVIAFFWPDLKPYVSGLLPVSWRSGG
jgi:hypothetical protein